MPSSSSRSTSTLTFHSALLFGYCPGFGCYAIAGHCSRVTLTCSSLLSLMICQVLTIAMILQPVYLPLHYLAALREEVDSSEGSSADEEAKASGAGWTGTGKPMQIGVGYTVRDFCDGQSLASPGRWPPATRQYPCSDTWTSVSEHVRKFSEHYGTTQLLMDLALGRVEKCPFPSESGRELKGEIIGLLSSRGLNLNRESGDRNELTIDFRFLALLLRASEDPDTQLGNFALRRCKSWARDEDAKEPGTAQAKEEVEVGAAKEPAELVTRGRSTSRVTMEAELRVFGWVRRQGRGSVGGPSEQRASTQVHRSRSPSSFPQPCGCLPWSPTQRQA